MISEYITFEEYLKRREKGKLLNPCVDSTFKAMFTQPTKESRLALKSFLEAAIGRKIKSVTLQPNDAPVSYDKQRGVNYDILVIFDNGQPANIEIQSFNQKYDYGIRAEYQVARLESTYMARGDDWEIVPVVYQITVLNFNYDPSHRNIVSWYSMRDEEGRTLAGRLNVIFIELPKTVGKEYNLEENRPIENWAIFLKNAGNPEKKDIIDLITNLEEGLMNARKSLSSISTDRNLLMQEFYIEIAERDRRSALSAATREGMAKGIAEGMAAGKSEGMELKAIETANNLLKMNVLTHEQISQAVGLSLEKIDELAQEITSEKTV